MGTKRTNQPVRKTVDQLSKANPRMNLRGRLNENVSIICGNEYSAPAVVLANAADGWGTITLNPGNASGRTNAAVNAVGRYFQKGIYLPGTFLRYIPAVGLNTNGNIIIGWLDSPDMMRAWFALGAGNHLNFIRDLNNAKTAPLWQELTFPLTQPPRRKIFMVDPSIETNNDALDQSTQGIFVYAVFGTDIVATNRTYGQMMIHCKERFEEVKSFVTPQP